MGFSLRQAAPEDDAIVADYFYKMWAEYDMEEMLAESCLEQTLTFIKHAREGLEYTAFIAEVKGEAVGCAACQVFAGLYPGVFQPSKRKYGYLWGVYVAPDLRGKGVAQALTETCRDYLQTIGCTKVVLHASPMGRPVYERLGFVTSNEMVLNLI